MEKTLYVIIRHGANAANQSLTPRAVVGLIEARNRAEAKAIWAEEDRPDRQVYANQYLEVIPASHAAAGDRREAWELEVLETQHQANCSHAYEHGRCWYCGKRNPLARLST